VASGDSNALKTGYPEFKPGEVKKTVGDKRPPTKAVVDCNEFSGKLLLWSGGNQFRSSLPRDI
jgi:hypothetical protein